MKLEHTAIEQATSIVMRPGRRSFRLKPFCRLDLNATNIKQSTVKMMAESNMGAGPLQFSLSKTMPDIAKTATEAGAANPIV